MSKAIIVVEDIKSGAVSYLTDNGRSLFKEEATSFFGGSICAPLKAEKAKVNLNETRVYTLTA